MRKIVFFCCCLIGTLQAQTLLQDAQLLTQASTALSDPATDPTARAQALGELVAILWFYDQDRRTLPQPPSLEEVLSRYQTNNTITSLIGDLKLDPTGDGAAYAASLQDTRKKLASGAREEILQLLYAEQAMDPADYLSLMRTMREYQEPPLDALSAIQAPAAADSQQRSGSSLFSQEAIIRGMFSFLIERAGEELVVTFLDRLLGKEMSTVAELFPTVITLYGNTDFAYSDSFLASLRDAFLQDFQMLDLRLPELLLTNDLFAELQADPVFYNILTVYTIAAMTRDGSTTIEEAVPLVSRNLYQRYQDTEKQRNLLLAETAPQSAEYAEVITALEAVVNQAKLIYGDIEVAETALNERALDFVFDPDIDPRFRTQVMETSRIAENNGERFANIFKAKGEDGYDLAFVPSLLSGQLPASLVETMGTLESYDKYFREPTSPQNRRAAGLALARRLTGEEFGTQTLDQYFLDWRDNLIQYDNLLLQTEVAAQSASDRLADRQASLEGARLALAATIGAARTQWSNQLNTDEASALLVLNNILDRLGAAVPSATDTPLSKLQRQEEDLAAIRDRLLALHQRIEDRLGTAALQPDPIAAFSKSPKTIEPLAGVLNKSLELREQMKTLREKIAALDTRFAANLSRSHANALPLLQMGEVFSNLMYLLRTNDNTEQRFLTVDQLQAVLLDGTQRKAFLGLLEQELGHSQQVGLFARDGLSFLVQATVQDLTVLPGRVQLAPDSLKFYQKSTFVVNTLNRLLETPLLTDPMQPDSVFALTQRYTSLSRVPDISRAVLDLIFYISTKNYRQALSKTLETTIRLTEEAAQALGTDKPSARNGLVKFLHQYGGFIGGLVDADSARQVHALLDAFADPPGSSRIKRQRPFTAGLNAYVGGLVGREFLSGNTSTGASDFVTLAPTIPVGFTFSTLLGKKYAPNPPSFSLFFSVVDLGSLATFNLGDDLAGDNQLTFRNILKPGVQLQWNIPKSPFYLGTGTQFGPHYREFDGELEEQRSWRYFISFGIDIVIKRFY